MGGTITFLESPPVSQLNVKGFIHSFHSCLRVFTVCRVVLGPSRSARTLRGTGPGRTGRPRTQGENLDLSDPTRCLSRKCMSVKDEESDIMIQINYYCCVARD